MDKLREAKSCTENSYVFWCAGNSRRLSVEKQEIIKPSRAQGLEVSFFSRFQRLASGQIHSSLSVETRGILNLVSKKIRERMEDETKNEEAKDVAEILCEDVD